MTIWQFNACAVAYTAAHGGKSKTGGGGDLSDERAREMGIVGFNGE